MSTTNAMADFQTGQELVLTERMRSSKADKSMPIVGFPDNGTTTVEQQPGAADRMA